MTSLKQIQYYNCTAYDTLINEIGKILPKFPTDCRHKREAILASVLGGIASSIIGLALKEYPVSYTTKDIKLCIKLWQQWTKKLTYNITKYIIWKIL